MEKQKLKEIQKITRAIYKKSSSFQEFEEMMKTQFVKLNDLSSSEIDEYNETYNIIEIAKSKYKTDKPFKLNKEERLVVDYYFYDKAPNGIIVVANNFERNTKKWNQNKIGLFLKDTINNGL